MGHALLLAIHMSLIFAVGGLITGSIWAKASWGHWWVWSDPTLVSYLIVVLLFATYQPLRFSIEDPERQARYASVFAIVAAAFVPMNFIVVWLAQGYVHPRVLTSRVETCRARCGSRSRLADRDRAAVRDAVPARAARQGRSDPARRLRRQLLGEGSVPLARPERRPS